MNRKTKLLIRKIGGQVLGVGARVNRWIPRPLEETAAKVLGGFPRPHAVSTLAAFHAQPPQGFRYQAVSKGGRYPTHKPEIYGGDDRRYRKETLDVSPIGVIELTNGHFFGAGLGEVFTHDGVILSDFSRLIRNPDLYAAFTRAALPKPRVIDGPVALLTTPEAKGNYYHWTFDLLPRLRVLEMAGYDLNEIQAFVVDTALRPFELQTLAEFGIERDRIVATEPGLHLQASRLIIPTAPLLGVPSPWAVEWLRKKFSVSEARPFRKIFIARKPTERRHLVNHEAVVAKMAENGFETVDMNALSVPDQRRLFAETQTVVSIHGAALTNLIWADPSTTVVELCSPRHFHPCFWGLCSILRLRQFVLFGKGEQVGSGDDPEANIDLDLSLLQRCLDEVATVQAPR